LPELITQGNDRKDEPIHWGSGPYAILLASTLSTNIKLLGFDLYGKKGKVNNLYNNTDGYSKQDSNEVDPSYWIYQIAKVFEWFPKSTFTVYNTADWKLPKEWNLGNVSLDIIDNL
jgi:endo-1,4-beta-D-glucanase Y